MRQHRQNKQPEQNICRKLKNFLPKSILKSLRRREKHERTPHMCTIYVRLCALCWVCVCVLRSMQYCCFDCWRSWPVCRDATGGYTHIILVPFHIGHNDSFVYWSAIYRTADEHWIIESHTQTHTALRYRPLLTNVTAAALAYSPGRANQPATRHTAFVH